MRTSFLLGAALTAVVIGSAPASAGLFTIDYYKNYTEVAGGVDVTGTPFFTESVDDVSFVDFNSATAPVGRPNATGPFAAIITGTFTVTGTEQNFTIGSDDGAYLFLDDILVGSNPGIHGYSTIEYTASFAAGAHAFRVEYFNGPCCGAAFGITSTGTVFVPPAAVPEPATWAMMIAGMGLVGAGLRRRRASVSFA